LNRKGIRFKLVGMKHSLSPLRGILLAALPLGLVLAGCGGGGGGLGIPTPTPTAEPVGRTGTFNGTLTGPSNSYFGPAPFQPDDWASGKSTDAQKRIFLDIIAQGSTNAEGLRRYLFIRMHGVKRGFYQGQVLPMLLGGTGTNDQTVGVEIHTSVTADDNHPEAGVWGFQPVDGATMTITEYSPTTITVRFNTIKLEPSFGPATETLTLDGTLTTRYVS
jgi:hypothetical protein